MASKREEMETLTHGALADIIASGSPLAPFATAELERRTTVYQEDAAHFQELAAEAQQEAAGAAKDTAPLYSGSRRCGERHSSLYSGRCSLYAVVRDCPSNRLGSDGFLLGLGSFLSSLITGATQHQAGYHPTTHLGMTR
jgi:hypothetical protein